VKALTVVIPNKFGQTPELTIRTLYQQTFTDFDTIIINDLIGNANRARNKGLKLVTTPYVLFSDNDIDWQPQALRLMYDCLENNPTVSIAYGSFRLAGTAYTNEEWNVTELKKHNLASTMSMVRTAHHPGFDEKISRLQDWDVWLTMVEQKRTAKYIGAEVFTTPKREGISTGILSYEEALLILKKKHNLL
jgi:hypothetical protein